MKISGIVGFDDLGTGVWIIVDRAGNKYIPVNMPNQLKIVGEEVSVLARPSDQESAFMSGTLIEITSFHTLPKFGN